jgi:hypothetical protein
MRQLHHVLNRIAGWWNEYQPAMFNLSASDFFALILGKELSPLKTGNIEYGTGWDGKTNWQTLMAHGTTHWFYNFSQKHGFNGPTSDAIYTYISQCSESAKSLASYLSNPQGLINRIGSNNFTALGYMIVNAILAPPDSEWTKTGLDFDNQVAPDHPIWWGNPAGFSPQKDPPSNYILRVKDKTDHGNDWYLYPMKPEYP